MKRPGWFGPKRLAGGIGPKSWEGWAALAAFVLVVTGTPRVVDMGDGGRTWLIVGALAVLLFVIYLTYEKDEEVE